MFAQYHKIKRFDLALKLEFILTNFIHYREPLMPFVYGEDEFGYYDENGYYFDEVGYYDEYGYYDDNGHFEINKFGIKMYYDPHADQTKRRHNRGDFVQNQYSQEFVEVKEEKPKRHQSRQHKDEKELKNKSEKKIDEFKDNKNHQKGQKNQNKMKKQESNKEKNYFEGHKEEGKIAREFPKKDYHAQNPQKGERKDKKWRDEKWDQEQDVKIKKMVFLNPYKSKFADFVPPIISNNSNYYPKNWNDGMVPTEDSSESKKQLPDKLKKKYTEFVDNLEIITNGVADYSENASLESVKKIYRNINQKVFNPTQEEKDYFDRYGLPYSVLKFKKQAGGRGDFRDYDPFIDKQEAEEQLSKGQLLEGFIRNNEFNKNVAFVSVEGLKNDVIILSEKDKNRSLERDVVVLRLIDPKYWDPLRENKSGTDNDKPIERRIIDEDRTDQLVGEGLQYTDQKVEESKGDQPANDNDKADEEDNDAQLPNDDDNMDATDKDAKDEGEGSDEESENDKSIVQLLKERKAQNFGKKGKFVDDKDNGLRIPNTVNTQQALIEWINTFAGDYRPKARVVFIKESPSFTKDVVMILRFSDNNNKFFQSVSKATPEEKARLIEDAKANISGFLRENRAL